MGMPNNLVFIRHGQSEANVVHQAWKDGEDSYQSFYLDSEVTVPDRSWRLTELGEQQAKQIGRFVNDLFVDGFNRYIVSPYTRTRETAALLELNGATWQENRVVRERFWGEIDTIPQYVFERDYPRSANLKRIDPLYWAPPGGESIAEVVDYRIHGLLDMLHRDNRRENVVVVTHSDFMWAAMLSIERWSDEEFVEKEGNPDNKIQNCEAIHYTRVNPETGEFANDLRWVKRSYPALSNSESASGKAASWTIETTGWKFIDFAEFSDEQLLEKSTAQPRRI
jgi:broad specificity phosphatase PhoE